MVRCTSQVLESYLKDYGWTYRRVGEEDWVTGFQGESRSYPLKLNLCDTWITFLVQPFIKLDLDWDYWPEISRYLLELNHHCSMVKLAIDENGHISLSLDVLADNFDFCRFSDALGILGYYSDHFYDDIQSFLHKIGFKLASFKFLT